MINEMAFKARQRALLINHFDANETMFLERELTQLRAKVFETKFASTIARTFAPKATDIAASADTYAYKVLKPVGLAKLINYKSKDIPRVDVVASEVLGKVRPIGASFAWDINELREAARLGLPLSETKMRMCRDTVERGIDQCLAFGSLPDEAGLLPDIGLNGLVNNALVVALTVLDGTFWLGGTAPDPADVLAELSLLASTASTFSDNIFTADTLLLPTAHYAYLQQSPFSTLTGESILTIFRRNNPQLTLIAPWYKLNAAGVNGVPRAISYQRDPAVLESVIPQEFEVMPPEMEGFEFVNNAHARCGGVKIYQPLAVRYLDFATS